jgi:hypothetical protein
MPDDTHSRHAVQSYEAKIAALFVASERLLQYLPTGLEPAGQDMGTTMRQYAIREFRKACEVLHIDGSTEGLER